MADFGVYAKVVTIDAHAGAGASATSKAVAWTDLIILNVECTINVMTRKIWAVDDAAFAALDVGVKGILTDAAASMAAIYVIMYDMSGYSSRAEAQTMIDINWANFTRDIEILKDLKHQDFITGA